MCVSPFLKRQKHACGGLYWGDEQSSGSEQQRPDAYPNHKHCVLSGAPLLYGIHTLMHTNSYTLHTVLHTVSQENIDHFL